MSKPNLGTLKSATVLATVGLCLTTASQAEIYKWRDDKGVIQYSDAPPNTTYTKATHAEMVNALQDKQRSQAPVKNANSNTSGNGNLRADAFIGNGSTNGSSANNRGGFAKMGASSNASTAKSASGTGATASGTQPQKSKPLTSAATKSSLGAISNFNTAGKSVTLFRPAQTKMTTPSATKTVQAAPAASSAAKSASTPSTNPTLKTASNTTTGGSSNTATNSNTTPPPTPASTAPSNIIQRGLMPAVDISKNITPAIGYSDYRIKPTTELPVANTPDGAFRVQCKPSHMSNDDPIVYPNQPGASFHHTFFGNTSITSKSDMATLSTTGNSTCNGGIMNRSEYSVPSMIDTSNNTPVVPEFAIFYYKTGALLPGNITPPPKGLRMITGNPKATSAAESSAMFTCISTAGYGQGWSKTIPACKLNETMQMLIAFPQCWDGKNLDSPDHKSHMASADKVTHSCPATHPIGMPQITLGLDYKITSAHRTDHWRLASDNYPATLPPGYSANADWASGWDEKIIKTFVDNCLNKSSDCHAHLLGDGRMFY